ncbi:MAG TPA: Xaa-Pro peptidase family protein [Patescibacteria group bacterium]|nr:Xaa-Pro peptidase family protein [Patescibacteria group bacterium]
METHFDSEFFVGNRQKLRTLFAGSAPIVITANGLLQRSGDVTYPFRQDSSFWYLTGIDEASIILVMDKGREYLILPERGRAQEALDSDIDIPALARRSGIDTILDYKSGWKQLETRLKRIKHIATLSAAPAYVDVYGMYSNPARATLITRLKEFTPEAQLLDLREHLTWMRTVKQDSELKVMQVAIDITTATLKEVKKKLHKFYFEFEIESAITEGFRRRGARGHAWEPMVASGQHAASPHYMTNGQKLEEKGFLIVDVGAEVSNYSADITRTYGLGTQTKRQRAIYNAVLEVQSFALNHLKPGITLRTYEEEVEQFMGEKLRELHLIKSISHENVRKYYPHGTSHFLGLDVHDVGDYDRPLEPNMVITVEPGIYILEEGIGVRIEDDILITAKGVKMLSSGLPRTLS